MNSISHSSKYLSTTAPRYNLANRALKGFPVEEIHCGCGFPHNLLLPMGNDCPGGGEEFDLVVIVTDPGKYPFKPALEEDPIYPVCKKSPVLCSYGKGTPYLDSKLPMGYPFDRYWAKSVHGSIDSLAGAVPNMAVKKVR